tara:strand:+ start:377 stop:649 length:273 start_codon:yes stop_codon:yes gene_type:complete
MRKSNFIDDIYAQRDDLINDLQSRADVVITEQKKEDIAAAEAELAESEAELAEIEEAQRKKEKKESMIKNVSIAIGVLAIGFLAYKSFKK